MKINIESDFHPLGNPKSESASAQLGIRRLISSRRLVALLSAAILLRKSLRF